MPNQNTSPTKGRLVVDVFQTEHEFCILSAIAGVPLKDIKIIIENCILIIKGARKEPAIKEEKDYYYKECHFGPFERQVILPDDVDTTRIKKSLDNGILIIRLKRKKPENE